LVLEEAKSRDVAVREANMVARDELLVKEKV
jgi:hypothetical protein